ncbi:MAG: cytochrome c family protein [Gammaproteobacteria bacterium]|nr:cytochrome c family protein [Gammaproteobacteria bacterium]|tara:strand:- start:1075 stop:1698 length:624 start_codon:yes stop_codon:yes gene_type:complete
MFKIRPKYVFYLTIFCSFFINNTYAEDTGEKLSSGCLGCHGIVSYSNIYPYFLVPKLANQHKEYIVISLKAYKSGQRKHPTMNAQASKLSDNQIELIADYFSKLGESANNIKTNKEIKVIEEINTCVACHGTDGNSVANIFPKIAGQHENYIYYALRSYKNGSRENPIMLGITSALSDNQMKKLSRYFSRHKGLYSINKGIFSESKK